MGRAPAPMTAGYAEAIRSRQARAAIEDGWITGFAVLVARPGYLLLDNVAVLSVTACPPEAAASPERLPRR